ncbi:MAG: type II toxin-antitoxin system VapC family toxin [Candidatus Poribacteria bacterium]|nr:type II toxin-antitoxin system VapC family toxin [Candidatus Poribacteria bacterium]
MREYAAIKPTVYVETSVISYLTSLPSRNSLVLSRQEATRQLWNEHFDDFEFIVSNIVVGEIRKGDEKEIQLRLKAIADFRILEKSPAADRLTQLLLDSGAVPQNSGSDAQHISIATVYRLDYLISWNFKHIVNETKRQHIDRVCREAGFQPTNLCTPIELIEEIKMKEKPDPPTDPVLEEIYRMKAEFNAEFNSMEELNAYLKEIEKREKARGRKYIPAPPPPPDFEKNIEKIYKELGIKMKQENKVSDA